MMATSRRRSRRQIEEEEDEEEFPHSPSTQRTPSLSPEVKHPLTRDPNDFRQDLTRDVAPGLAV
jgi:hypothetical protein